MVQCWSSWSSWSKQHTCSNAGHLFARKEFLCLADFKLTRVALRVCRRKGGFNQSETHAQGARSLSRAAKTAEKSHGSKPQNNNPCRGRPICVEKVNSVIENGANILLQVVPRSGKAASEQKLFHRSTCLPGDKHAEYCPTKRVHCM